MDALNTSANTSSVRVFTSDGHASDSFKEAAAYAREHPGVTFSRAESGRAFAKAPKASTTAEIAELKVAIAKLNAVIDALHRGGITHVTHIDMPVSPSRVWSAING